MCVSLDGSVGVRVVTDGCRTTREQKAIPCQTVQNTAEITAHDTADNEYFSATCIVRLFGALSFSHVLRCQLAQVNGPKLAHVEGSVHLCPCLIVGPVRHLATKKRRGGVGHNNGHTTCVTSRTMGQNHQMSPLEGKKQEVEAGKGVGE